MTSDDDAHVSGASDEAEDEGDISPAIEPATCVPWPASSSVESSKVMY